MSEEFRVGKLADIPSSSRSGPGSGRGIVKAMRGLAPGEALFVPCREGETISQARNTLSSLAYGARMSIRTDHEANGIWIYRKEQA